MRLLLSALLAVVAACAGSVLAQDVPGRVGRISAIEGSAALYQDPDRGWEDAYVNAPVTSRNSVWTDPDARVEMVVGPIALRLDDESQLDVSLLDDATLDATLERGSLAARIRHFRPGNTVRISTPQASFLLQSEGRYRLDADPDRGESRLSVFAGTAGLQTAAGRIRVSAGQSVIVWDGDGAQYAFQDVASTELDRWAHERDARWVERRAPEFVSYEMTGYEDLDSYGDWAQDPVYGAVWFPTRVQEDWAPYRYGRWAFVRPWGWTWVDAEPWGYAPFHYGRWVHVRDRWAWCPGRRVDRPAWAPALVGFIGGGDWSAGVASSGGPVVGWFPLAPSEPYRPWYKASAAYLTRVNAVVRNVPQAVSRPHIEWNRDRGATVVHREALAAGRPVQQARVSVTPDVVRRAPVAAAPMNILPSPEEAHRAQRSALERTAPAAGGPLARRNPAARPAAPGAPTANPLARPSFAKPAAAAPRAAPHDAAPPPAAPRPRSNPLAAQPASPSSAAPPRPDGAREAQERGAQERQRERGAAEQQRARDAQQQQERAAREAQQQRERAAGEGEQQRAREAQQQQQQQERAAREAQQQRERAAGEAEQQRARETQQQERQRAAREAAQQQEKASQEQQRAARESAQQQQKAAEAQQRAAQEQQRRTAEAAAKLDPQKAEPRKGPPPVRGPPEEREKRDDEGKRGRGEGG
ncbi:MAG TPA: DUF6600 domain-containing protein [Usitatibacter sp.]|jgi:DNA segregation ATPase FtsK/SpoIIIE-like protein|nr:DUF6600 domain-containing protein [Usitatibacter sp.]